MMAEMSLAARRFGWAALVITFLAATQLYAAEPEAETDAASEAASLVLQESLRQGYRWAPDLRGAIVVPDAPAEPRYLAAREEADGDEG